MNGCWSLFVSLMYFHILIITINEEWHGFNPDLQVSYLLKERILNKPPIKSVSLTCCLIAR